MALAYEHSKHFADLIPDYKENVPVLVLVGRDCMRALKTTYLTDDEPYVVRTPMGYTLAGSPCAPGKYNGNIWHEAQALQTTILPEITSPLTLQLCVADQPVPYGRESNVFATCEDDEDVGLSQNDQRFLQKMAEGTRVTDEGNVELPLPLEDDNGQ